MASSYRGELLGMLAIHLFLLATKEHYMVSGDSNQVFCDKLGLFTPLSNAVNGSLQAPRTQMSNKFYVRSRDA